MGNKNRNYGIDLLRIVSMFMVVNLHVLGRGGTIKFHRNSILFSLDFRNNILSCCKLLWNY